MDEQSFREAVSTLGFSEPERLTREPNLYNAEHTHDFDVEAFILEGELSVTTRDGVTVCKAGDRFSLSRGIPHVEQYGPHGAEVLVAKRD